MTFTRIKENVKPQLAKLVNNIPSDKDWLYEIKYDGYRLMSFINKNKINIYTRNKIEFKNKIPLITNNLINKFKDVNVILDGELVVFNKNSISDFQELQHTLKTKQDYNLVYVVFDILFYNNKDLTSLPLIKRKAILEDVLKEVPENIMFSKHIKDGKYLFSKAKKHHLEGIIGKKENSPYLSGRSDNWIKIKCRKRQEFLVLGYINSTKKVGQIKALLLGYYQNKKLVYAGKVGTGINSDESIKLYKKLKAGQHKCNIPSPSNFVKPNVVVEIEFAQWTKSNLLRQPSYKGIRIDKNPKDVVREDI